MSHISKHKHLHPKAVYGETDLHLLCLGPLLTLSLLLPYQSPVCGEGGGGREGREREGREKWRGWVAARIVWEGKTGRDTRWRNAIKKSVSVFIKTASPDMQSGLWLWKITSYILEVEKTTLNELTHPLIILQLGLIGFKMRYTNSCVWTFNCNDNNTYHFTQQTHRYLHVHAYSSLIDFKKTQICVVIPHPEMLSNVWSVNAKKVL